MWDVGCGMLEMWDVGNVRCWGGGDFGDVGMLGMWDIRNMGCWDLECWGCAMLGM